MRPGSRASPYTMTELSTLLDPIQTLHEEVRRRVVSACEQAASEQLSAVARDVAGDTIYAIDCVSEELVVEFLEREVASRAPLLLVAEGLPEGKLVLPYGRKEEEVRWRIIVDPIDGTRGLMYQKRSAWILTGVARNRGSHTGLHDIELAVQTEIPLVKQHLCDTLWAFRGEGGNAVRTNRLSGEKCALPMHPSRSTTIAHGFAMLARFFPGGRQELAAIDDEIVDAALGQVKPGKALCFEDQYISTGGQLYELMAGHDRFIADLRPLMDAPTTPSGTPLGLCCHPYDLCTELIARELGVAVTNAAGNLLDAPLDVESNVAWAGYANDALRRQIEPLLQRALRKRGLLPDSLTP